MGIKKAGNLPAFLRFEEMEGSLSPASEETKSSESEEESRRGLGNGFGISDFDFEGVDRGGEVVNRDTTTS